MSRRAVGPKMVKKLTRGEKRKNTKEALINAAAKVVGEVGYSKAMVSIITSEANVAQGTFYNYFQSRQALFDQLLPILGEELLDYIRDTVSESSSALDYEKRSFIAFFEFLKMRPEFYRILYEAEVYAPTAFKHHIDRMTESYVRKLEKYVATGELNVSGTGEIKALAYTFMGVRHYLCMFFSLHNGRMIELPGWVVDVYVKLVSKGVYNTGGDNKLS